MTASEVAVDLRATVLTARFIKRSPRFAHRRPEADGYL